MPQAPTIGRRVYFWPASPARFNMCDDSQPLDAGVVYANPVEGGGPSTVNLLVTDHHGLTRRMLNVPFGAEHLGTQEAIDAGGYADWMPFQKTAQAASS